MKLEQNYKDNKDRKYYRFQPWQNIRAPKC